MFCKSDSSLSATSRNKSETRPLFANAKNALYILIDKAKCIMHAVNICTPWRHQMRAGNRLRGEN
jgi:hypothetical protein